MIYDAFISYSSKNKTTADAICHTLEESGVRCFIAPRDIPLGKKYSTVIVDAIKQSKVVVLVFSEQSATSPWVESEINVAFSNRKPIVPYKIDTTLLNNYEEFYLMLNNRHWIESYPDYRERFRELVDAVTAIVGVKRVEPKPTATPAPAPKPISRPTPIAPVQTPRPTAVPTPTPTPAPTPFPTNMPPVKKRHTWAWVVGVLLFAGLVWGVVFNFLGSLGEDIDPIPTEETTVAVEKQEGDKPKTKPQSQQPKTTSKTATSSVSTKKVPTESAAKKTTDKSVSTPTTKAGDTEAKKVATSQAQAESATSSVSTPKEPTDALPEVEFVQPEMVFVEGGTFTMGATSEQGGDAWSEEKPTHRVTVSDFYIGKYEITQAQWKAIMGSNPSYRKGDNLPVECVSWTEVQEFIRKLNAKTGREYRLPTEAEWEYAARGGAKSKGYKYSGSFTLTDVAWCYDNSGSKTHPVGQKRPNELGIYDMSGNVAEWCQDWYSNSYYSSSPQSNPTGPNSSNCTTRVVRDGSYFSNKSYCRVSSRSSDSPNHGYHDRGFRLALLP